MIDLADLYRRFWKWYNDNISHVDFRVIESDAAERDGEAVERVFRNRFQTIYNLLKMNTFYNRQQAAKLSSISHHSWEELSLKLALRGY